MRMTTEQPQPSIAAPAGKPHLDQLFPWLPLIVGLLVLYVPTLTDLLRGIWSSDEQGHGPIVLGISCWLLYRKWPEMLRSCLTHGSKPTAWGWPVFIFGLLLYAIGRSQDILIFEVGSAIWLLAGIGLLSFGATALKAQWFALFFMLFMIPLPGPIVDAATLPMKTAVSYVAEYVLFNLGYPIARSGVILQIGQYKLLVADACAGLHTLFSLEALGLLYLNIMRHDSLFRNLTLGVLIIPISFTANVIRVITLTLVTYYLGDEAGQGFLHGFAGMVLFLTALMLIMAVDSALQLLVRARGDENKARTLQSAET
jgi:exosortase B